MITPKCLVKLRSYYNALAKRERIVAEYIIKNPEKIPKMSIDRVADILGVGGATIVRVCRKIGFDGYHDFKIALAEDLAISKRQQKGPFVDKKKDEIFELLEMVINENIKTLRTTKEKISYKEIKVVAKLFLDSDNILVFADGISSLAAQSAKYKFMKLGLRCEALSDYYFQCISTLSFTDKTVIFILNLSGIFGNCKRVVLEAKRKGLKIVSMVNYQKSDITEISDHSLFIETTELPIRDGELTSLLSQINALDMLYSVMAYYRGDRHIENITALGELLLNKK